MGKSKKRLPEYVDIKTVAIECGVSDRTARRWLAAGLRHYKFGTGQQAAVRVKRSDLDAWLEDHAVERIEA